MARLPLLTTTIKKLFALSGNRCAFPGCKEFLVDGDFDIIGEICHIEAAEPLGVRYNKTSSEEHRRGFENLLILCHKHHIKTNNATIYTVEKLREIKRNHEQKYLVAEYDASEQSIDKSIDIFESNVSMETKLADSTSLPQEIVKRLLQTLAERDTNLAEKEATIKELENRYTELIRYTDDSIRLLIDEAHFEQAEAKINHLITIDEERKLEHLISLGNILKFQYKYREALAVFLKALDQSSANSKLLTEVAVLYLDIGEYSSALDYMTRLIALPEFLQMDQDKVVFAYGNLGLALSRLDRFEESKNAFNRGLEIITKPSFNNKGAKGNFYNAIATLYSDYEKWAEAKTYFEKAISMLEDEYKVSDDLISSWNLARIYHNISPALHKLGETDRALFYEFKAINILNKASIADRHLLSSSQSNLAEYYLEKNEVHLAQHYIEIAIKSFRNLTDYPASFMQITYDTYSRILRNQNKLDQALQMSHKAIELGLKASKNGFSSNLSTSYCNLAYVLMDKKDLPGSLHYLNMTCKSNIEVYGLNSSQTIKSYKNLAMCYIQFEIFPEAEKVIKKAERLTLNCFNIKGREMGNIHLLYCTLFLSQKEYGAFKNHLKKAKGILTDKENIADKNELALLHYFTSKKESL
jgi:hypothetical protein